MFGLSATGLAVARALGRRGYSVLGVDPRRWEIGRASRYVQTTVGSIDDVIRGPAPHHEERSVGFVCGDPELIAVCAGASALEPYVQLPGATRSGLAATLVDKRAVYDRLVGAAVDVPATVVADTPRELVAAARSIPGPWIVKPALAGASGARPFAEKARRIHDPLRLLDYSDVRGLLVQSEVAGPIGAIVAWAAHVGDDGEVGPTVTIRKRRERPAPFGSASWVVTVRDDEVDAQSRLVVRALGLTGTVGVEWKRAGGRLWFIEVNPRPVLWLGVAEPVIVDAFQALRGAPRPPATPVEAGLTWRYAARDPLSPRAEVDALWAADDPLPGLLGPAYTAVLAAQRLTGRRFRRVSGG